MILEFKLLQEYTDFEGKKKDVLKFAFDNTGDVKDVSIEYMINGNSESHNVIYIENNDIEELIWFLQAIKDKNKIKD